MQQPQTVIIGIATNYSPKDNFMSACRSLKNLFQDIRFSPPIMTPPLQNSGPDYLNAIAVCHSVLMPHTIIQCLKLIEASTGRVKLDRQCIPLDLDLLAYGNTVDHELRLPRAELLAYDFNRIPAAALLPNWLHPLSGKTLEDSY